MTTKTAKMTTTGPKMAKFSQKSTKLDKMVASGTLDVREAGENGSFTGHGSVFGVVDSFKETVAPGAFKNSLAAHKEAGTMPALLWQHRAFEPIGVFTEMREDETGLFVRGQLALETQRGKEAHALLRQGALNGLSVGFAPVKDEKGEDGITKLTEIDLWEVSLVTFPANDHARVSSVKANKEKLDGASSFADVEGYLREAYGVSRGDATAIVAKIRQVDRGLREEADAVASMKAASARLLANLKY